MKKVNQKRAECGAILVEFAILLPFLLLIMLGIIEFGLLFYNKQVLTNASREGARSGIARYDVNGDSSFNQQDIIDAVDIYLGLGLTDTDKDRRLITFGSVVDPVVTVVGEGGSYGTDLTVTVSYNYTFLIPGLLGLGTSIQLNAETVMGMERVL
jgi:hypothetical protein